MDKLSKLAATAALLAAPALATPTMVARNSTSATYRSYALNGTQALNQDYYDSSTGLWASGWWPSGNQLTTIADFAAIDSASYLPLVNGYIQNTFVAAPASNGPANSNGIQGTFLNDFYDDEMWWLLGWIKAYDVTQNETYLDTAVTIFENVEVVNGSCGGHLQNKDTATPYVVVVSDAQYIMSAASLANRVSGDSSYYANFAQNHTTWLYSTGLFNSTGNGTLLNGLDTTTCQPDGAVYTYNQGVAIGALVEMNKLTGNQTYLDTANEIAHGTILTLVDENGILTEPGGTPSDDGDQFKGVFARNLQYLQQLAPDDSYVSFLQKNADSIWNSDRTSNGTLGVLWQGPINGLGASSHGSALDCLVGAAAVS